MKRNRQTARSLRDRAGLTLIEVIVLFLVLGLAAALLLPATRSARGPARRLQCLNNMKQLAVAVANSQSLHGDKFPALAVESKGAVDGWPIQLLALLDSAALARQIRDDRSAVIDPKTGQPTMALRFLTCPEDSNNFRVNGGLSYAANVGYVSSDVWGIHSADDRNRPSFHAAGTIAFGSTDLAEQVAIHRSTGLFWRTTTAPADPSSPAASREQLARLTGDDVQRGDGLSTTLLFAENTQAQNWASSNMNDIGFGLRVPVAPGSHTPDRTDPPGRIGESGKPLTLSGWSSTGPDQINARAASTRRGEAPRPSSFHAGGTVNVVYADGHASVLNEAIDPSVYARLLTWDGEKHGQDKLDPNGVD